MRTALSTSTRSHLRAPTEASHHGHFYENDGYSGSHVNAMCIAQSGKELTKADLDARVTQRIGRNAGAPGLGYAGPLNTSSFAC